MGHLHNLDSSSGLIESRKNEVRGTSLWSEEHDQLPLKQRLKILLARGSFSDLFPDENLEEEGSSTLSVAANDGFVKNSAGLRDSESFPSASFAREGKAGNWSYERNRTGGLGHCNDQVVEANKMSTDVVSAQKVNGLDGSSLQQPLLSSHAVSVNFQCADNSSSSSLGNPSNYPGGVLKKIKNENTVEFFDELDHVVLKERQRMLLSSRRLGLTKTTLEGNSPRLSSPAVDGSSRQSAGIVKEETDYVDKEFAVVENLVSGIQKTSNSVSSNGVIRELHYADQRSSQLVSHCQGNKSVKSGNMTTIGGKDRTCSLEKKFSRSSVISQWNSLSTKSTVQSLSVSNFVHVKVEPLDINETSLEKLSAGHLPFDDMHPKKSNAGIPDDSDKDKLDHMLLRERMKLLSAEVPCLDVYGMECLSKMVPSGLDCQPIATQSAKPLRINRLRKRRRTATDSVERALEEDAPGLLQVLIMKGISVDEIKLYGERESDEALDDLSTEDNFTELEAVIAKLFSQRNSLLKLAPLRCSKGEKPSYCVACLFSLVEQARYLKFRNWPAEWGWCRDLQSFIFVFERHNRIVLERPEYGYATYFFELMDSLPIDWQMKRLVTAMKLTSCSRVTLIENKPLVVGEDLTEGEARVLMEYGWVPNSGLGSMLNYCDRVVHDRKTEDPSEWRSKIGKLLIDGYNGGCIVSTDVPKKLAGYSFPQIKVEIN